MPIITTGTCYLCGFRLTESSPGNEDHFPPRGIFAKPFPANLLWLPAHMGCNNVKSRDEEYFRTIVTCAYHRTPEADAVWDKRTLPNTIKGGRIKGELAELSANILPVVVKTAEGEVATGLARLSSRRTSVIRKVCEHTARGVMAYFFRGRKIHELSFRVSFLDFSRVSTLMRVLEREPIYQVNRGGRTFTAYFGFEAARLGQKPDGFCLMIFHEWLAAVAFCGARESLIFSTAPPPK